MTITASIQGMGRTRAGIKRRGGKLANLKAPHKAAVVELFSWVQRNIVAEGGLQPGRFRWPPLADSTGRRRRVPTSNPKMLRDTGFLFNNWDLRSSQRSGVLKSRAAYSGKHERGGRTNQGKTVPQRKILPTEKKASEIVFPIFRRHVRVSIR